MPIHYTNDRNSMIATCDCGCGQSIGIRITPDFWTQFGDYVFIDTYVNKSEYDRNGFRVNMDDSIKAVKDIISKGTVCKHGVCLTKKELRMISDWCEKRKAEAVNFEDSKNTYECQAIFCKCTDGDGVFIYDNGKKVYIGIEKMDEQDYELFFYQKYDTEAEKIVGALNEFKSQQINIPEISLDKANFTDFCSWLINAEISLRDAKGTIAEE